MAETDKQGRAAKSGTWGALGVVPLLVAAVVLFVRRLAGEDGADYDVKPFPLTRKLVVDTGRLGLRRHRMLGLVEVDVTEARRRIRDYRAASGESISFTAFVLACVGQVIEQNRYFHARRDILGRLVLFDEVDCALMIEIELEGQKFPLAHVVRGINKRSLRSIHEEIRAVQADPDTSSSLQLPPWLMTGFLLLPAGLRDVFYLLLARLPRAFKAQAGTVMVSSVGMFGEGSGWGIGTGSPYTMSLLLGGIAEKPVFVDGEVAAREILSLTIELDHDVIDGAPASRFVSRLKGLMEAGYGLEGIG